MPPVSTTKHDRLVTEVQAYPEAGRIIRSALYQAYYSDPRYNGRSDSEVGKEYRETLRKVSTLIQQSQTTPANDEKWNKVLNKALHPWTQLDTAKHFAELVACIRELE